MANTFLDGLEDLLGELLVSQWVGNLAQVLSVDNNILLLLFLGLFLVFAHWY